MPNPQEKKHECETDRSSDHPLKCHALGFGGGVISQPSIPPSIHPSIHPFSSLSPPVFVRSPPFFSLMERAVAARRAMGCTPSKAAVVYSQEQVCPDLDTCSTFVPFVPFVPGLKSSAATPETRRLRADTSGGRRPFLRVPYRDFRGRSVSQSSPPEPWSSAAGSSQGAGQSSVKPRSQTPDLHVDSEGCWTS